MKASEIKEKMSKISKNDISSFFQNNWKYFTAVILFVVLAVVMIKFSSGNKDKDNGRFHICPPNLTHNPQKSMLCELPV